MEGEQCAELPRWRGLEGLAGLEGAEGAKEGRQADAEARAALSESDVRHVDDEWQLANSRALAASLGIVRGTPMSVLQADGGMCNVSRNRRNCAAAVIAFELRLRGFDVAAKPYDDAPGSVSFQLGEDTRIAWRTIKGQMPQFTARLKVNRNDLTVALQKAMSQPGSRYHIGFDYSNGVGHIVAALRLRNLLTFYDPQTNEFVSFQELLRKIDPQSTVDILRVDRLLFEVDTVVAVVSPI